MPVSYQHLRQNERTVTKDYGDGDTLTVVWRPGQITPADESAIADDFATGQIGTALALILSKVVVSWDLLGDDGQPIPISPDALKNTPGAVLDAVWTVMKEDLNPPEEDAPSPVG